jgi:hypothetical protein
MSAGQSATAEPATSLTDPGFVFGAGAVWADDQRRGQSRMKYVRFIGFPQ